MVKYELVIALLNLLLPVEHTAGHRPMSPCSSVLYCHLPPVVLEFCSVVGISDSRSLLRVFFAGMQPTIIFLVGGGTEQGLRGKEQIMSPCDYMSAPWCPL